VPGYLVGGEKRKAEKARLRKGITVLIGTPGRLLDHVQHTKSLRFDKVGWLVLDEADRLFDMGYEKDIARCVQCCSCVAVMICLLCEFIVMHVLYISVLLKLSARSSSRTPVRQCCCLQH